VVASAQSATEHGTAGLVAIIVDPATYAALEDEVGQYASDVSQDMGVEVVVGAKNWSDPQAIRAYLQGLRDQDLIGAVLLGDIPTTYFYALLMGPPADRILSDFYYMELDTDLVLDDEHVFGRPPATVALLPDIWVGRLKPTESGEEGLAQLRDYFRRNHAYRRGEVDVIPKILVLDDMGSEAGLGAEVSFEGASVASLVQRSGLYEPDDVVLPNFMSDPMRGTEDLAGALQMPYELAYLNHHGTPTTQQCGQTVLTSADIQRIHPQPLFYLIWSCSNGDFTSPDYIAGSYLFQGDGLVALAATVPVLGNIESGLPYLFPLSLGATFGQAYQYGAFLSPMTLLGDPTLQLRQPREARPRLQLEQTELEFGEIPVATMTDGAMPLVAASDEASLRITATNAGQAPLRFSPIPSFVHFLHDGQWDSNVGDPITAMLPGEIPAGESQELTFGFNPTAAGSYTGFAAFYTNDPDNTLVVIPFSGSGKGEGDAANESGAALAPDGQAVEPPEGSGGGCESSTGMVALEGPASVRPGEPASITLYLSPLADLEEATAYFVLPDGLDLADGEVEWTGALAATEAFARAISIRARHPGQFTITGNLEGQLSDGTTVFDCAALQLAVSGE
jgi:hypothetical protein